MFKFICSSVLTFIIYVNAVYGQCSLNLPDSVCPLQDIVINTSLSNVKVNLCTAIPQNQNNIVINPGFATNVYQFKIIKENGRYFAFGQVFGTAYMNQFEFTSDFVNIGTTSIAPIPAGSVNKHIGSDMVKISSGKWIALMPASDDTKLLRLEFDSIDDPNPTPTDYNVPEFSLAKGCKIVDNYLFVANEAAFFTRIEFDNDFQNILSVVNISGPITYGYAIDIEYDCDADAYYGFIADDFNKIIRIDFGPSLANNNPSFTIIASTYSETIGIDVAKIKDKWYLFTNNFGPLHRYLQFSLDSITASPVLMVDTINAALNPYSVTVFTDSSVTRVFPSANFAFINFVDSSCITSPTRWFEDTGAVTFNFQPTSLGYQYFSVYGEDTNHISWVFYDSVYVSIPPPEALFTNNGTCEGQPISFTDLSQICYGNITGWFWDFGDSNTSTLQNPVHSYTTGGQYTVTLTVYAANGDSSVYSKNISVVPLPVADFTPSTFTQCSTYPILFTDNSIASNDSIVSWNWNFDNGDTSVTQHPNYIYNISGNYNVQLIVSNSNGCIDSITRAIQILSSPLASFTHTSTCAGGAVLFSNTTDSAGNTNVTYSWLFGNGDSSQIDNPSYSYLPVDSSYHVTFTATASNGCQTVYSDTVTISHPALVSFTISADTVCKNVPVTFINTSVPQNNNTIIYKRWECSDGFVLENSDTLIHSFSQAGTATIALTIVTPTYCDTIKYATVVVLENPAADFTFTNVCLNDSNLLVSTSVPVPGDNIAAYTWNFGDSTALSNSISTYHSYNIPGAYNVTLHITSTKNCSDSITKSVQVYELPVANFITPAIMCSDSALQFTDFTFVNSNDSLTLWSWNFGDTQTATLQNPLHNYSQPGNYNVQLIAQTLKGCRDTVVKPVLVKLSPSPSFTADSLCFGNLTHFTFVDLSPSTGLINAWSWNFGELGSSNSTLQNPVHQYQQPAAYMVTVTATDTNQCFNSLTDTLTINSNPVIGFTISHPCEQYPALFTDTSVVANDIIKQWKWETGSLQISDSSTASYTFNSPGNYLVTLTATSNSGCSSTAVKPVTIYANPVASFTATPYYASPNQTVTFNNSSQLASSYWWDFNDGSTTSVSNPLHSFADTGFYQVMLTAISDKGCTDTIIQTYNVLIPNLEIAIGDVGYTIQNNLLSLTVKLLNLGNINIDNYQLTAYIDDVPSLIESGNLPITVASPSVIYSFKSKIEISDAFNPGYFCIEVKKPNGLDDNPDNNKQCKSLKNTFDLLNIIPNPTDGDVQLYINSPFDQQIELFIFDNLSKLVRKDQLALKKGFNDILVTTNTLSNGLYYLKLSNSSITLNSKFIKE